MRRALASWRCWVLLLALAYAPGAAAQEAARPLSQVEPAQAGMDAATLAKIDERIRGFVEQNQISGAVTLVVRDGKIVHLGAVGQADVDDRRAMTDDTLFAVASMTKPITGTAVMILRDEGKLALDDPVAKYLPEFADAKLNGQAVGKDITLKHLLTHTSGVTGDQRNEGSLESTAQMLAARPLSFAAGEKWSYSPGLSICGRVVEVVSGQPFDRFLRERIFEPLGMKDTTFNPTPDQQKRLARLYKPTADKKSLEETSHWINDLSADRTPNPSGGLFSTARDLAQFYQAILNGGELNGRRILSAEAVKEMTTVQSGELATGFTPGNGWGLGWCVVRQPQGVTRMLSPGTFGHGGAFGTQGWVDPERKMIYVLLIQRLELPNSDASELRDALQDLAASAIRK